MSQYDNNTKILEGLLCVVVSMFLGAFIMYHIQDIKVKVTRTKTPKPLREMNTTNEVAIIKLAFDTGYRACLENILDGYILYADDPEEFENFLHAQVDKAVLPNLGLEQ